MELEGSGMGSDLKVPDWHDVFLWIEGFKAPPTWTIYPTY